MPDVRIAYPVPPGRIADPHRRNSARPDWSCQQLLSTSCSVSMPASRLQSQGLLTDRAPNGRDLVERPVVAAGVRAGVAAWPELAGGQCDLEHYPCLHTQTQ